jgi:DNA repair protein RadC
VLVQAQLLVERHFHRGGPIVNRPDTVRAMLQLKLSAHPHSVFACFFLTKRYEWIDYVELFNGTTDNVVVHLREE